MAVQFSGVLLASSLLAFLLSSKLRAVIATPISQLVRATTSVSETGDYSMRAEKLSGDELGVLVDRFNEMLAGIQSRDNIKKASIGRGMKDVEKSGNNSASWPNRCRKRFSPPRPRAMWIISIVNGWNTPGFLLSRSKIGAGPSSFIPTISKKMCGSGGNRIDTGEPFSFEHRFRRADGKYRWHLSRAHAMRDPTGNISMWIGSNTDIHEQKEKEEALRRANDDLQQFAYSASHDLQEPIRNVAVYSEIVAKRYHSVLDADGQLFLGFLTEGGRRLATLVNDLLAYTRASRAENRRAPVDSSAVLQHTLSSLAEAIRESRATVTYDRASGSLHGGGALATGFAESDRQRTEISDQDPPRIHISAVSRGRRLVLFSARQRNRNRSPIQGENLWRIQAAPS